MHGTLKSLFLRGFRPYLWLITVCLGLYAPTLYFGFVNYDDNVLISDHLPYLKDPAHFKDAFTRHYFASQSPIGRYYRPLVTASYMVDTWIGGGRPGFYHATNVLLFIGVCCLLFLFLKQVLKSIRSVPADEDSGESWLPFLGALVFAVHPLQVMAAAWIPGRNDTLLACFFLPSLWCFIRHRITRKPGQLWGHMALFTLALLTKETAVVIPLLALAWIAFVEGNLNWRTWLDETPLLAWLAVGLCWFVLRALALGMMAASSPGEGASWLMQAGSLAGLGLRYYGKTLFPLHLALLPDPLETPIVYGLAAGAVTVAVVWLLKGRALRVMVFGLGWGVVVLALSVPFSDPFAIRNLGLLEHRMVLPWAGILTAWLAAASAFTWKRPRVWAGVAVAVLAGLAVMTAQRLPAFEGVRSFWSRAVRESPRSSDAWHNYGSMKAEEKRYDEAESAFEKSLELNPKRAKSHVNLSYIHMQRGAYGRSIEECFLELKNDPFSIAACESLALLYGKTGNLGLASEWRERGRKLAAGEAVEPWGR